MNTETTAVTNTTGPKQKVDRLFALRKITQKDIEDFSKPELEYLGKAFTKTLQKLKGVERDNFINKIELVIQPVTKSEIWEINHSVISNALSNYMRAYGIMPTQSQIAEQTGLSRQTVAKHFAAYKKHPEFTAQTEQFKFMAPAVLANIYKFALNGDIRAARLYLEMVGELNKPHTSTVVNEQNNYIQINNTILSQENLKQLTAEQLDQIEKIITKNGIQKNARAGEAGGGPIRI